MKNTKRFYVRSPDRRVRSLGIRVLCTGLEVKGRLEAGQKMGNMKNG